MEGNTKDRVVEAASRLLDRGGQSAVTLRAVAEAVGVSHNAPYRHFRDRSALLAAVAEQDFAALSRVFRASHSSDDPKTALKTAVLHFIDYAREHPARYRLLFSGPDIASPDGSKEAAALDALHAFSALVARCQETGEAPPDETLKLTGLIYATVHGAIDLELSGRAKERKGLGNIEATIDLLLDFIWRPHSIFEPRETQKSALETVP